MKLSKLIKALQSAKKQYGDVPVVVQIPCGTWVAVREVMRLHPFTGPYWTMNRNHPVNAIGLSQYTGNESDLVIFSIN